MANPPEGPIATETFYLSIWGERLRMKENPMAPMRIKRMTRPRPQFQIRNPIEYSITQIKSICLWIGLLTIVSSTWANGQANNGLIFYGETDFRMLSPTGEIIGKSVTGQVPVWAPGHKQFAFKSGTNTITITTVATNTSTSI